MSAYGYNVPPQIPPGYPAASPPPPLPGAPRGRRRLPVWGWVLIVLGGLVLLSCAGGLAFVTYIGAVGPDTKVYTANEVPRKFVVVASGLGLLDPGERVTFFYSDALLDVRDGMYFVTDRKVVVYIADATTPATVVPFGMIEEAELDSSSSMWEDGWITLTLADGEVVVFPVSSEAGRDQLMFNAIEAGRKAAGPE